MRRANGFAAAQGSTRSLNGETLVGGGDDGLSTPRIFDQRKFHGNTGWKPVESGRSWRSCGRGPRAARCTGSVW